MLKERKLRRQRETELKKLRDSIDSIQQELGQAYMNFNEETNPALTDAYIYEISALRARYDHAFRNIKNMYSEA